MSESFSSRKVQRDKTCGAVFSAGTRVHEVKPMSQTVPVLMQNHLTIPGFWSERKRVVVRVNVDDVVVSAVAGGAA